MYCRSRYRFIPSERGAPNSVALGQTALSALLQFKRTSLVELRYAQISVKRDRSDGTGCLQGNKKLEWCTWGCVYLVH